MTAAYTKMASRIDRECSLDHDSLGRRLRMTPFDVRVCPGGYGQNDWVPAQLGKVPSEIQGPMHAAAALNGRIVVRDHQHFLHGARGRFKLGGRAYRSDRKSEPDIEAPYVGETTTNQGSLARPLHQRFERRSSANTSDVSCQGAR